MKLAPGIGALAAAACIAAATTSFGKEGAGRVAGAPDLEEAGHIAAMMTNELRRQEGLHAVAVNRKLEQAARYFAEYMAKTGRYDHEADGRDMAGRAAQRGYDYCAISENIAYLSPANGSSAAALAHAFTRGWKNSPGHLQNMLDPDVTETATALARSSSGYYYAVQMFARPSTARVRFQIANTTPEPVQYKVGHRTVTLAPQQVRTHQQCRPQALTLHWPGLPQDTTIHPGNGERVSIVRSETGSLRLKRG
jgi:uncharacterized protein YkwD